MWSHTRVAPGSANSDICAVGALAEFSSAYPAKFSKNTDAFLATWRNGDAIRPARVTAILLSAVSKNGGKPSAYSLHSLRVGGATALYRATKDIDLVARFDRWGGGPNSISDVLWGIHQMMKGLGDFMITGGHVLRKATNDPYRAAKPKQLPNVTNHLVVGNMSTQGWKVMIIRAEYAKTLLMGVSRR